MRHVRTAVATTFLLLVATLARAAWLGPWGNPVAPTFHGDPVALFRDGGSGVFVAYQGVGVPGGGAIRLQHVLDDGTVAPGWPAEGAVVCSLAVATPLGVLKAIPDGAGGSFLVWDEGYWLKSGTYYVQHLLADGTRAGGWSARGRRVLPSSALYSLSLESVADGAGGVLFVWSDGAQVLSLRVRADGTNAPGFPATGNVLLVPPTGVSRWVNPAITPAHGGGSWLCATLTSSDSLAAPWTHRLWRLNAAGVLDPNWAGDDGNGFAIPTPSSALASGEPFVLDDGTGGAFVLMSGPSELVAHVLSSQALDPAWPEALLELGQTEERAVSGPGVLAMDGVGGLYALWPSGASAEMPRGWLRRVRTDSTLDPAWASPAPASPNYQPLLLADAAGVYASGARVFTCPHQDCLALGAVGRWSADRSIPAGWPGTGDSNTSPGEYALPESAYANVADMVRDGAGGVFVAWTTPDVLEPYSSYGDAATVRVMRFRSAGPVAGVGSGAEGPLSIRGTRFTRDGIRCSISGDGSTVAELTLFDLIGRRMTRADVEPGARDVLVPGTRALPAGLYLVRVRTRSAEAHAKVFVVR